MGWYQKGKAGEAQGKKLAEEEKIRRDNRIPFKFRLRVGDTKKGTFLDNPNFFFSMHTIKNSRGTFDDYTCLNDTENCPFCNAGFKASYVLAATIIDHAGYIDKEEKRHTHVKQLAIFKQVAQKRVLKRRDAADGKSLKYCCLEFSRDGDRECSTGEEITFFKKLTGAQLKKLIPKAIREKGKEEMIKWLTPFDLEKIFKPKSVEELTKVIGGKPPVGSADDVFSESTEEVVGEDTDLFLEEETASKVGKKTKKKANEEENSSEEGVEDEIDIDALC